MPVVMANEFESLETPQGILLFGSFPPKVIYYRSVSRDQRVSKAIAIRSRILNERARRTIHMSGSFPPIAPQSLPVSIPQHICPPHYPTLHLNIRRIRILEAPPPILPLRHYLHEFTQFASPAIHKNSTKAVLRIRAYCLGFGYVFRPFRAPSRIFGIHDAGGCD
jgi:hypothetical protein